jgi:TonB family protein
MRILGTFVLSAMLTMPLAAQVPRIPTVPPPPPSPSIAHHCADDSGCPFPGGIIPEHTNAAPGYPAALRQGGVGGTVRLAFAVTPDGVVEPGSVRVIGEANPDLAAAASQAVSGWEFTVLGSARRAANVPVRLTVEFVPSANCAAGGPTAAWGEDHRRPRLIVTGCPAPR